MNRKIALRQVTKTCHLVFRFVERVSENKTDTDAEYRSK